MEERAKLRIGLHWRKSFMSTLNNDKLFWRKKEFISFILSIFVFLIHISSFEQYENSGTLISFINTKASYFLTESITRVAVPMFLILSGIAFFRDYDNKKYIQKLKKRIFTLLIPYLLWNTLWMLFHIAYSYTSLQKYFVGKEKFALSFGNVLKGIFLYESNTLFWYIFNLIVFAIAAPLIYALIRNKYIGIVVASVLTVLHIYGIELPAKIFFEPVALTFYIIGAIIGKHFFDAICRKSSKRMQWGSILFLTAYVLAKNIFSPKLHVRHPIIVVAVFCLTSFALWNIVDLFIDKIKPRAIFTRSFAIYAIHVNLSAVIAKLCFLCMPRNESFAIPNFIITFILTLIIINLGCSFFEKHCPKIYSIFMGMRTREKITLK